MFRWVDHTAEAELGIEAASEREVFADALEALGELLGSGDEGDESRVLSVSAPDRPSLLVEWLEELVFLAESEGFCPDRLESLELSDDSLTATVRGRLCDPPPLIKGVTYHRLTFEWAPSGYRAGVVFDV